VRCGDAAPGTDDRMVDRRQLLGRGELDQRHLVPDVDELHGRRRLYEWNPVHHHQL
jgi:hypothetical protein